VKQRQLDLVLDFRQTNIPLSAELQLSRRIPLHQILFASVVTPIQLLRDADLSSRNERPVQTSASKIIKQGLCLDNMSEMLEKRYVLPQNTFLG
jgi:hypothetical protein